jgi:F-type H+-transporting ATPase subunit gamma
LLPLDEKWKQSMSELTWPVKRLPQVIGEVNPVLSALIREYLFVSLFRACAESLASENEGRLEAMQRAEKNIEELLKTMNFEFNRLRQDSIVEELFDVIAGFEAFNGLLLTKKGHSQSMTF